MTQLAMTELMVQLLGARVDGGRVDESRHGDGGAVASGGRGGRREGKGKGPARVPGASDRYRQGNAGGPSDGRHGDGRCSGRHRRCPRSPCEQGGGGSAFGPAWWLGGPSGQGPLGRRGFVILFIFLFLLFCTFTFLFYYLFILVL